MTAPTHIPVLLEEVLRYLTVRPGGYYVDCTTGLGGHSEAIAARMGEEGRLLCIDQDGEALELARARLTTFGRRVSFARANFRELAEVAAREGFERADGILLDLGVSSMQLDTPGRGFSFALEGPIDMRLDQAGEGLTAGEIVNTWEEDELANLFYRYGEVRQSRRAARAVIAARPLRTTWELARAVGQALGGARIHPSRIHPATQVFLALRIRVNDELDRLDAVLPQALRLLGTGMASESGGRLCVISFHSLEDRIVKQFMRREAQDCLCPPGLPVCRCGHRATLRELTRKAVRPGETEVARNPRARSAVLRAAERLAS